MPTLIDFIAFIRGYVGIPDTIIADDSPYMLDAYQYALDITTNLLALYSESIYSRAVYNLGAHTLLETAQDNPALIPPDDTYFADMRKKFELNAFSIGTITSASDSGTSSSLTVPEWASKLGIGELQLLKTPWGQQYLNLASKASPFLVMV